MWIKPDAGLPVGVSKSLLELRHVGERDKFGARAIATIATGPLSSTAFVPSVWLSITIRWGLCPLMVAITVGVCTRL